MFVTVIIVVVIAVHVDGGGKCWPNSFAQAKRA
jgi:hypothetical protein